MSGTAKFFAETRQILQNSQDVTQVQTCLDSILSWLIDGNCSSSGNNSEHEAALRQVQLCSRLLQQDQCTSSHAWVSFFWSAFSPMSHVLLTGEPKLKKPDRGRDLRLGFFQLGDHITHAVTAICEFLLEHRTDCHRGSEENCIYTHM